MDSKRIVSDTFIDVTIMVPVQPNLMNRDDCGKPKTTWFHGTERLSPSGQFIKRGWRRASINGGVMQRSMYIPEQIIKRLAEKGRTLTDDQKLTLTKLLWEKADKVGKTEGLLFFSDSEVDQVGDVLYEQIQGNKDIKSKDVSLALKEVYTGLPITERLIISLYGRMFAGANTGLNAVPDGALQVCKALSTAPVNLSTDYFTAVDEYRNETEDDTLAGIGSAHIGERMYAPGCNLLIQARIDTNLLKDNAGISRDAAGWQEEMVSVLTDLVVTAIFRPLAGAAAQGTYAISSRPFYAVVTVPKRGALYDLGGAFAKQRRPQSVDKDTEVLREYMAKTETAFREVDSQIEFCLDPKLAPGCFEDKELFTLAIEETIRKVVSKL